MAADQVKMCQKELGSRMADEGKLKVVWDKLKEVSADRYFADMLIVSDAIPKAYEER